jgi:3-isopropylmalate dehydrogenase
LPPSPRLNKNDRMLLRIVVLPGDGIGPEVTSEAVRVLEAVARLFGHEMEVSYAKIGGAALREFNNPLPDNTLASCLDAGAALLGAVGDPAFDNHPINARPEAGLLRIRRELGAYANLRPAKLFPALIDSSPLKPEVVKGTDILIVRELLGGLYFGEPRKIERLGEGRVATNTMRYGEHEIERIARMAFELARSRRNKVTSVDKANVLECSKLWRETVTRVAEDYAGVELEHMYVDSCSMALVAKPQSFDVMLAENMFGDILSDEAGAIVGSLGLLASASIGGRVGLYEPVHGSAPDIAGRGIANPLGAVLSVAMMLRHSFQLEREAACVEQAVERALAAGHRTKDIAGAGNDYLPTSEMGNRIIDSLSKNKPT